MSDEPIATVTTDPSTVKGKVLLNTLTEDYTVELDQVHGDNQVNFVLRKE